MIFKTYYFAGVAIAIKWEARWFQAVEPYNSMHRLTALCDFVYTLGLNSIKFK